MSSFVYKYIDTWDKAYLVCNLLRQGTYHVMAFDLEGVNLGRQGQVTLLQLAVDESCVFCFDILFKKVIIVYFQPNIKLLRYFNEAQIT